MDMSNCVLIVENIWLRKQDNDRVAKLFISGSTYHNLGIQSYFCYQYIHFLHRDISPEYMENAQNTVEHYPVGPPSLNIGVAVSHVSPVYVLCITSTVSYIV